MRNIQIILFLILVFCVPSVFGNRKSAPSFPLSHCYHWLKEKTSSKQYLQYKYDYAAKNNDDFSFVTDGAGGAAAGPGIYCAKTPGTSTSYGDRVIRLDFTPNVVLYAKAARGSKKKKYCGWGATATADDKCQSKTEDVQFFRASSEYYVIRHSGVIKSWSANSDQLLQDLANAKLDYPFEAAHVDNAIQAIHAERKKYGGQGKVFSNGNARDSILDIINSPTELAKLPPLTIVLQVSDLTDDEYPKNKKINLIREQLQIALKDSFLLFSDFEDVLEKKDWVKELLIAEVKKLDFLQLGDLNSPVIAMVVDKFFVQNDLATSQLMALWQTILASAGKLESLVFVDDQDGALKGQFKVGGIFAEAFEKSLPGVEQLLTSIKDYNVENMLYLLDLYSKGNTGQPIPQYVAALLDRLVMVRPSESLSIYSRLNNDLLKSDQALASMISSRFNRNDFENIDPVYFGILLDQVPGKLETSLVENLKDKIMGLSLPLTSTLTYKYLDDFKLGKFKLPSFMSTAHYLQLLFYRALLEKSQHQSNTNIFRMLMSGYYHYFNEQLEQKDVKDDKDQQAAIMSTASKTFFSILRNLQRNPNYSASYSYALLQNSSLFYGKMDQVEHPIESYFALYQSDDSTLQNDQFDRLFESVSSTAFDGSYIKFLIRQNRQGSEKAGKILLMMAEFLTSADYQKLLQSKEFMSGQEEKKHWSNIITTDEKHRYTGSHRRDKVDADICHFSRVIYEDRRELEKYLKDDNDEALKTKNGQKVYEVLIDTGKDIYENLCQ